MKSVCTSTTSKQGTPSWLDAAKQNRKARDIYKLCADQVGIPGPDQFKTEDEADQVLGEKLGQIMELLYEKCPDHGLSAPEVPLVAQADYFRSKGWIVDDDGTIQTGQT